MNKIPSQFLDVLINEVLKNLRTKGYRDSTLNQYRMLYSRLNRFMKRKAISEYTVDVGKSFLDNDIENQKITYDTISSFRTAIRRLDDCLLGVPYRCTKVRKEVNVPKEYQVILTNYLTHCKSCGNKQQTIKKKNHRCLIFLSKLKEFNITLLEQLVPEVITKICLCLKSKEYYLGIKLFLRYLYSEKLIDKDYANTIPKFKRAMPVPSVYSIEEIKQIEAAVDTTSTLGKRNYAVLLLLTRVGLRVGDAVSLKIENLNFSTGELSIIQQKTGGSLKEKLPDDVLEALRNHIDTSQKFSDGYIFHSLIAPFTRLSPNTVWHFITKYMKKAGVDPAGRKHGPHVFRASLATSMVNDGVSYEETRRILGHTDPNAIKHYVRANIEKLRPCALTPPPVQGIFAEYLSGRRSI